MNDEWENRRREYAVKWIESFETEQERSDAQWSAKNEPDDVCDGAILMRGFLAGHRVSSEQSADKLLNYRSGIEKRFPASVVFTIDSVRRMLAELADEIRFVR